MPVLEWDQPGAKMFQTGVDRGVLYIGENAFVWNGLTGLDEDFNIESKAYYQDGVKYLDVQVLGEFAGKLKAFTYPQEFEDVIGKHSSGQGLYIHDQRPKSFGLSYRTKIGNDIDGIDHGYIIHLLYNLRAVPDSISNGTIAESPTPMEFSWSLSSTPEIVTGYRPTAHVSLKSTEMDAGSLELLEEILYGTDATTPYLPSLTELTDLLDNPVVIVDNGDGTWTATGSDRAVDYLNDTTVQILGVKVTTIDDDTYTLETS
jgi:hypothetical protein